MSLIKNSIWNLGGFVVPTLIAIPGLGLLARNLGTEKFGLFTLAFAIIGYASIFDAGLTRAVIREIAINRNNQIEQRKIISTSTISVGGLGFIAALVIYALAPLSPSLLKVSAVNSNDLVIAFKILAFSIPVFLLNQIWLAYLEGHEKFANINLQRIISGSCMAGLPAMLVLYDSTLTSAIVGLLLGRSISLFISFYFSREIIVGSGLSFEQSVFKRLIKFGGWMTVSNVISPIMAYFDRFVISNMLGANQLAYYAAPAEGILRALNVPSALARALFPKLSNAKNKSEELHLEKVSYFLILLVCFPIGLLGFIYAKEIMITWMGDGYSGEPVTILKILIVGFFFNSLSQIPYAMIQAAGKSHVTAIFHLIELIPYLFLLYFLVLNYSLYGVAIAWVARIIFDFFALFLYSKKRFNFSRVGV